MLFFLASQAYLYQLTSMTFKPLSPASAKLHQKLANVSARLYVGTLAAGRSPAPLAVQFADMSYCAGLRNALPTCDGRVTIDWTEVQRLAKSTVKEMLETSHKHLVPVLVAFRKVEQAARDAAEAVDRARDAEAAGEFAKHFLGS